jgi:hypothetical protein
MNSKDTIQTREHEHFSERVYANLPPEFQTIFSELLSEPVKRDVALTGMITCLSAGFARWRFIHGAGGQLKEYSPHLYSLVVGPAASGKSLTRYGIELVRPIIIEAYQRDAENMDDYRRLTTQYRVDQRSAEKAGIALDRAEPQKPPRCRFLISAGDTSQAALMHSLRDNPTGTLAFDSEADTVAGGNRRDFGGYSDILRKGFEHESLNRGRLTEGESFLVENPRLAFSISGTAGQLPKLIFSDEDGLFSRFWFYVIPDVFQPYKGPDEQTDVLAEACRIIAPEVHRRADFWNPQTVLIRFTDEMETELTAQMQDKQAIEIRYGGNIGASWLRLGLITKRVAATLSGYEGEHNQISATAWRAAIEMLPTLKTHCLRALSILRQNYGRKAVQMEDYLRMKETGKTDQVIADQLGVSRKTLATRKREWEM